MTPTDQTPDAVRAAIAEVVWFSERDSSTGGVPAKLPPDMAKRVNAIYDRLAQIGALRPVGVTFSLEEANIIQDALRHGTSVDEALAMLDERVASYLPDAAARN